MLLYFSSRNPKKAIEHTDETLPVHIKSNTKANTRILPEILYIRYM
jgi:hypothetical protein